MGINAILSFVLQSVLEFILPILFMSLAGFLVAKAKET